jgi:4-hydroxy-tetrahydrodipicolinate synthase
MTGMTDVLKGVYNITPTPFHDDGTLDHDSLRRLTTFTRDKGVDGMTILGVLGEADKLTERERDDVITATIEAAGPSFPICVGTTHAGTDGCIAFSRRAAELGAAAVMIAPPKLARTNDAALKKHYLAVAGAIDLPVVVQDFPPAVGGITMSVDLIAALAAASPRLVHLKLEDDPSPMKVSQVLAANPAVQIFGGLGGMMFLEELRHGAIGTMTGFAFPEILVDIYRRFSSGDRDGATEVFYKYLPIIRFENQPRINLALRKHIYHLRGVIASSRVRSPFTPVDTDTLADLDDILARLSLLGPTAQSPRGGGPEKFAAKV